MPSRAGAAYIGVCLMMLLTSANFGLALGYALTFLLGSLALTGLMHTYRNLSDLVLRPGRAGPVFAGATAQFDLVVRNPGRAPRQALLISAGTAGSCARFELGAAEQRTITIAVPTRHRGWQTAPRLLVETRYPLGIFRAWAYWQPAMQALVYPAPEDPPSALPDTGSGTGSGQGARAQEDDLAHLRTWTPGDSPRRIAWKIIARRDSEELLVKQFEGTASGELLLDLDGLPGALDLEARLSRLSRWVLEAERQGRPYALRLHNETIGPGLTPGHRAECLQRLALHGHGRS